MIGWNIFHERRKDVVFLIFISFLISFTVARLYVFIFGVRGAAGTLFPHDVYTLHHFYYGVVLLMIAGWLVIVYSHKDLIKISAVLYGAGLGLFFDELGLLLTEFTDYWAGITYTAVVIISLLLLNMVFFSEFWRAVGSSVRSYVKEHDLVKGPWNLLRVINVLDEAENRLSNTGRIATVFTGSILIFAGFLILIYPDLIKWWIALAFITAGISHLIKLIRSKIS